MKLSRRLKKVLWGLLIGTVGSALFLWFLGVIFQPLGNIFERWYDAWFEKANRQNIATDIPSCITGFVPRLLAPAGEQPTSVNMQPGVDRTYICDNASIEAPPSEFPKKLADTYPGCFTYETMITHNLSLNEKSPAVCRSLYRVDENGRREPTTYELGVNICLGARARTRGYRPPGDQEFPRPCTDNELRAEGFLPRR